MLTGRPGPVHLEVPMDVQAEAANVDLHDLERRIPVGRQHPAPEAVDRAVEVLRAATRPVIVVGGGAITSEASGQVLALAERWQIPVVTTWNGKSAFPEDHELFAGSVGQTGTMTGNAIASSADGSPYSPDFAAMGRAFGIESWKVNDAASLEPTLRKAVQSGAPALVEVPTDRDAAGPWVPGW
ncbi:thiamine pyrophosphate-dependent enzyme [Streptomyces collinus]|uniref:thiamine pyrophosphate-dependent enzyme n=1 Tax=Streptomyces collinus TaxID=42684 RepID=UPI0037CD46D5